MSRTNVPNFKIVDHTEVQVDEKGTTIPRDLNEKYYGNNLGMGNAIVVGDFLNVDMVDYEKFKGENATIIIDANGRIIGDASRLSKTELEQIAETHPEVLRNNIGKEDAR